MRVVLDTNVFISGIFWDGNFCSQIINKWRKRKFELVSSIEIVNEFTETLKNFKIKIPNEIIEGWRNLIFENSVMVEPDIKINVIKDDSDDNKFIETAIAGKADFIITQDNHLLRLKDYNEIKIIHPEEAVNLF